MDKTQSIIVFQDELVHKVITSTEASEILNITDSYMRKLVARGEFEPWEYRKTSKVLLFNKESITSRVDKFKKRHKK